MNPDISKLLFHCSSLPDLMTSGRSKTEPLGETAKTVARNAYIEYVYGRKDTGSINKYTQKGIAVETDGIALLEQVTGEKYFKNQQLYSNEFVTGTPDMVAENEILDNKASYNIWTFAAVTEEKARKDYGDQLMGYMDLTGKKKARLVYSLVSSPPEIVEEELYRLNFLVGETEARKYKQNFEYDDIPPEMRIKIFEFDYDQSAVWAIHERVVEARHYLANQEFIKPYRK